MPMNMTGTRQPLVDVDAALAEHHAKWEPIVAAWAIAKHYRAIATLLPQLNEDTLNLFLPGLAKDRTLLPGLSDMLRQRADAMENANSLPMVPTDEDRMLYAENTVDMLADMNYRERREMALEDATDAAIAEAVSLSALEQVIYYD